MNYFIMIFYTVSLLHSHSVWCATQPPSTADQLAAFRKVVRNGGLAGVITALGDEDDGDPDPDLAKGVERFRILIGGEERSIRKNLSTLLTLLGGEGSLTEQVAAISELLAREENTIRRKIIAIQMQITVQGRERDSLQARVATLTEGVNAASSTMAGLGRENRSLRDENTLLRSWIVNLAGVLGYPSDLSRDELLRQAGVDWNALKQLLNAGTAVKRAALGPVGKTVPATTLPQLCAHLKAKTNGNNLKLLGMTP